MLCRMYFAARPRNCGFEATQARLTRCENAAHRKVKR
jgi:hypothetical protein